MMKWVWCVAMLALGGCDSPEQPANRVISPFPPLAKGLPSSEKEFGSFGSACGLTPVLEELRIYGARDDECRVLRQPGFSINVERFAGPAGDIPLFIFRPSDMRQARRIVVWLVGGPGENLPVAVNTPDGREFARLARQGVVTIFFGYAGTFPRFVENTDTIDLAADELVAYARFLERRQRAIPIVVLGESLGGYIAARASPRLPRHPIVLVAPPVMSPRELLENFSRITSERARAIGARRVTIARIEQGRLVPIEERMLNRERMLRAIVADHLDMRLEDMLRPNRAHCYSLVYGTADIVIGIQDLPGLRRRLPAMRVIALHGVEHDPRSELGRQLLRAASAAAAVTATC